MDNDNEYLKDLPELPPKMWNVNHFQKFLDNIELSQFKEYFKQESVDGSVFFDITKEDLEEEFKGKIKLLFKKFELYRISLSNVQKEREKNPEFSFKKRRYLEDEKDSKKEKKRKEIDIKENNKDEKKNSNDKLKTPRVKEKLDFGGRILVNRAKKPQNNQLPQKISSDEDEEEKNDVVQESPKKKSEKDISSSSSNSDEDNKKDKKTKALEDGGGLGYSKIQNNLNKKNKLQLIFKNDHNFTSTLNEKSGYIGRDKDVFFPIKKNEVSRKHCLIDYTEWGYFLVDNESSNGTFIGLPFGKEFYLKKGAAFLLGTFLYEVIDLKDCETIEIALYSQDLKTPDKNYKFNLKNNDILIGSESSCHLLVKDDNKIDSVHAAIKKDISLNMLSIQTLNSPLWLRVWKNERYPLTAGTIFRVGVNFEFQVSQTYMKTLSSSEKNSKKCVLCKKEDKSCVIFPCQHKMIGINCLKDNKISHCPECFGYIQQYMRLFT